MQGAFSWGEKHTIEEDGEVGAYLLLSKKPISSENNTCKDDFLEVKELVLEEDGEVGASLLHSKKSISSKENMCKEHLLGGEEHAIEEDG
eukprot:8126693-Ditylum_brightwellii.AAC.1